MFLLDTNILSAMMRPERVPEVAAWIARQDEDHLFTSAISHAEIFAGLAIMPGGRRRREFETMARQMFDEFENRVLAFDTEASHAYAGLFALRRQAGRPVTHPDLMIASIATSHNASMVTRDISGFEGCGLTLINPWDPQ